jgi:6-pyruvoyltetrahydropterin/6-carboxytetrahydropterin synthase
VRDRIIKRFDHTVVISQNAPHQVLKTVEQMFDKYEISSYQPTCENLINDFAGILTRYLPEGIQLHALKLQETESSYAEWLASDQS